MTCKEVKRLLKQNYSRAGAIPPQIESHAQYCVHCNQELAINKLIDVLVADYGNWGQNEESPWDEVRLVNRIKSRIQELGNHGTGSWDTAIIAVKGWLIAFGATAILLLALSSQLAKSDSANQAASDKISHSNTNWGEYLISSNSPPNLPSEEDSENAH